MFNFVQVQERRKISAAASLRVILSLTQALSWHQFKPAGATISANRVKEGVLQRSQHHQTLY